MTAWPDLQQSLLIMFSKPLLLTQNYAGASSSNLLHILRDLFLEKFHHVDMYTLIPNIRMCPRAWSEDGVGTDFGELRDN